MDTRQLEYVLAIAEEKNISRAAERLFLSQSALSQQLAKLEAEGLPPLFTRQKGEMQLTDAGKVYVNGARTILKLERDALAALEDLRAGRSRRLRVSVSPRLQPIFYTRILPWLKRAHPEAEVRAVTLEAGQVRHALERGEVDLALFPSDHHSNVLLDYTPLCQEQLVLACTPQLADADLAVLLPAPGTHLRNLCDRALAQEGRQPRVYAETSDPLCAIQLVGLGECAALLPASLLKGTGLIARPLSPPFPFYTVAACRRGEKSALVDEVIQRLRSVFRESGALL